MKLSIIVAVSENNVIGIDNQLPWHLPADLKYFKNLTTGHTILMGRKTFESIGRPLPNRENIVITRDEQFQHEGIIIKHSIEDAIHYCRSKMDEVFIIGGDTIYQQTISWVNRIYYTRVHVLIENGTAFFPELNMEEWKMVQSDYFLKDEKNQYDYTFEVYDRMLTDD
jgi:dihydrofolate reductase